MKTALITTIDADELAVRMCEASYGLTRPPGTTGTEALEAMEPESRDGWRRAAEAALLYWRERLNAMQKVN